MLSSESESQQLPAAFQVLSHTFHGPFGCDLLRQALGLAFLSQPRKLFDWRSQVLGLTTGVLSLLLSEALELDRDDRLDSMEAAITNKQKTNNTAFLILIKIIV